MNYKDDASTALTARSFALDRKFFRAQSAKSEKDRTASLQINHMRQRILISICLLTPLLANANPVVIEPGSVVSFWIVAFAALAVEAGVIALLLMFCGLSPFKVFIAFFFANIAVFLCVFLPLLQREWLPVPVLELLVVLIDGLTIKLLARLDIFQNGSFAGLSWLRTLLISAAGNATSYFVGNLSSHT